MEEARVYADHPLFCWNILNKIVTYCISKTRNYYGHHTDNNRKLNGHQVKKVTTRHCTETVGINVCTRVKEDAIIGHLNPKTRVMKEARQDHINAGNCSPKPKTSFQI